MIKIFNLLKKIKKLNLIKKNLTNFNLNLKRFNKNPMKHKKLLKSV
jgi:hypothetical protein